jgi:formylglycine-generating enzyme required for sulfatase activity/uncharacterized caspase-like protein
MGKNWAISIGINQYDNLQTLNFAKRDAEAMAAWFREEAKFDQVFLFTADSPPISANTPIPTQPIYGRVRRFLQAQFEQPLLKPEDNLWFFFAGHGMRHADKDYLMLADSDPGAIEQTAISVEYITERLRRSRADNVVLLLDACREESSRSGLGIGEEKHQGVITFYSCAANEKSWEIAELQHGSFTHTLLTGLRLHGEANCATVERLDRYINSFVPQLNIKYQKPIQNPYLKAEPPYKMYYILLEQSATLKDVESLKLQASLSENSGNFELAEQIWIRVLGVSRADLDAISAIQRIAIKKNNSTPLPIPQPVRNPESPGSSRSGDTMSSTQILELAEKIKENNANSSRIGEEVTAEIKSLKYPHGGLIFLYLIKNRRQFLTYIGLGGTGLLTAFGLKEIFKITTIPGTIPKPELLTSDFLTVTVDKTGKIVNKENHQAKYLKEDLGNNITLDMVQIPGGSFKMGSPESEKGRYESESPQHEVNVPAFSMGKFVVTQEQYQQIMGNNPSHFTEKGAKRPVEQVSWNNAVEFCQKLSEKTGREYRLPSEAEWEYACRAGTTTPFHFGETITTELANYDGTYIYAFEPKGKNLGQTTNVYSFSPNAFGLYNMHGNIWELCQDDWHNNYIDAPKDGSAWTSPSGNVKAMRGGSWIHNPRNCRSASRNGDVRDVRDYIDIIIGFRVVCAVGRT